MGVPNAHRVVVIQIHLYVIGRVPEPKDRHLRLDQVKLLKGS